MIVHFIRNLFINHYQTANILRSKSLANFELLFDDQLYKNLHKTELGKYFSKDRKIMCPLVLIELSLVRNF